MVQKPVEPRIGYLPLRERVLLRPEMYIGRQWDEDAFYLLLFSILEDAVDPEHGNDCSSVAVLMRAHNELSIVDNGRGLPPATIRWVLTVTSTARGHVYHQQVGYLNYRAAVLNAVSERLYIETTFNTERYALVCKQGEMVQELKSLGPADIRGTQITLRPDPDVFGNLVYDTQRLLKGLQQLATAYPLVAFTLEDTQANRRIRVL